jgi:hypothetical protein
MSVDDAEVVVVERTGCKREQTTLYALERAQASTRDCQRRKEPFCGRRSEAESNPMIGKIGGRPLGK